MGLDIVLGWPGQTQHERDAILTGPIEGNIGYLRCAYDEMSFNKWAVPNLGGRDLYWIFDYTEERLTNVPDALDSNPALLPDWDACAERASEALSIAMELGDNLFLVPLSPPFSDATRLPKQYELLNTYREDRERLSETWAGFKGVAPPLKSTVGRLAADFVKIQAVYWSQHVSYKRHMPPVVDSQPVLVCEGPPELNQGHVAFLKDASSLIAFGKSKGGWLHWSG
jgi:hypothetical protein